MARRLRPPSEPPRPQNGHSPLPPEAAPWTAAPESAAEVPWDRPAADPWPPATEEATADLGDAAPATHPWPPAPATTEETADVTEATDATEVTEAADAVGDQTQEPEATSEGPMQPQPAPWDTETAPIWGGPAPWDPQAMTAQTDGVAEAETPSAPEGAAEPEAEADATDLSVPGRPAWDVPTFAGWDEAGAVDDRPSDMLDAYDEMIPVVAQRVAEAQAAAAEPTAPVEPEPVVEAEASFEPESAIEREPQSPFTWPSLLEENGAASEPVAEAATAADSEVAPWSDFVEGPREFEAAPTRLTQHSLVADQPVATSMTADPYDAEAPVLDDVEQSAAPMWLDWSPASDVNAVVPSAVGGKILGPTPPDDLFEQPASPVLAGLEPSEASDEPEESEALDAAEPTADVTYHEPEAEAESDPEPEPAPTHIAATTTQSLVFSTGPGQPPLVLRIELAIVEESIQLRSADTARRVGPWSDEEPVTPRHPEFEPRTHAPVTPVADNEPAADASLPWAAPADALQGEVVDLPWDLPALVEPNPTAAWTLNSAPADPLASLPAATFAPAAPSARPVDPPHVDPPVEAAPAAQATTVDASASAVQSVALAPAAAAPAATTAAVTAARPQTNPDQSDLWFLASEPGAEAADGADTTKITPTSTGWTAILTIGMAVVVIFLVLVFVYMMTSLLH